MSMVCQNNSGNYQQMTDVSRVVIYDNNMSTIQTTDVYGMSKISVNYQQMRICFISKQFLGVSQLSLIAHFYPSTLAAKVLQLFKSRHFYVLAPSTDPIKLFGSQITHSFL
jgi:hypothetical protein